MSRVPAISPAQGGGSFMVAWRLAGQRVLVVGGGNVAAGRVRLALEADATVLVVAPQLGAELRHRWANGELDWRPDRYADADLEGVGMVLACLDDEEQSRQIAEVCRARGIPVNCADIPDLCDFWFASQHRDGPLQLALSTNGQGPGIGARLVREVAAALPKGIGRALEVFGRLRQGVRAAAPEADASARRMGWLGAVSRSWSWDDLAALDDAAIAGLLERFEAGEAAPSPSSSAASARGARVRLVGAGPGDPELLTVAGRRALEEADLVLADRLVPPAILELVRGELRIARKVPGRAQAAQEELDAWTLEAVQAGRDVVRLKCGDPFVFGRGGEELRWLAGHGVTAEVVPGVTSALAAPAAAQIPTTMRGFADRVTVLTAVLKDGAVPDVPTFHPTTTFVFLMGVRRLGELCDALVAAGFPVDWPAAIVERATWPEQRSLRGSLRTIPGIAQAQGVQAPATIVVGRVVDALTEGAVAAEVLAATG